MPLVLPQQAKRLFLPATSLRLVPSHPLAPKGGCWVFSSGARAVDNLVGPPGRAVALSSINSGAAAAGQGLVTSTTVANAILVATPPLACRGQAQTLVWVGAFLGVGTEYLANPRVCSVQPHQSSEDNPYVSYGFFRTADADLTFAWNNGSYQSAAAVGSISTARYGQLSTVAVAIDAAGVSGYSDGKLVASSATVGTISYTTPSVLWGGADNTDTSTNTLNLACYVYNRRLSAAEIAAIHADPYQMFAAPAWLTWPMDAGGTPATTATVSARAVARIEAVAAKASTTAVTLRSVGRVATAGIKGGVQTVAARAASRLSDAAVKGGVQTAVARAAARMAAAVVKGGLAVAGLRATGTIADAVVKGGVTAGGLRALARAAMVGTRTGANAAVLRASARAAIASTRTGAGTVALSAAGRGGVAAGRAATSVGALFAHGRAAVAALKGAIGAPSERASGRLSSAGVHAGAATVQPTARGILSSAGAHAGAAQATVRATGRYAAAGTRASTGAASIRASASLVAETVEVGAATVILHARAMLATLGAHAGAASGAMRGLARFSVVSSKSATATPTIRATGWQASIAAKATAATAGEKAIARLATTATSARAALARLAALASLGATGTSSPAFEQAVGLRSTARLAATGVKGGLTALAQRAAGLLASAGIRGGTGPASVRSSGLLASAAVHGGIGTVSVRSSGLLSATSFVAPAPTFFTKVGSFVKSAAGAPADNAVTGLGFAPKAVIFWSGSGLTSNTFIGDTSLAFGMGTDSEGFSVARWSNDANASGDERSRASAKALTFRTVTDPVATSDLTMDADGFTLTWTTNNSAQYIIHYLAIGGADIIDAKAVQWTAPLTAIDKAVTGVGFKPDLVIHLSNARAGGLPSSGETGAVFAIGAMDAAGGQGAIAMSGAGGISPSGTVRVQRNDSAFVSAPGSATPSINYRATFVSMDADGFTVNFATTTAAADIMSLCIKGGNYKVGATNKPTGVAPAAHAVTGVGFTPTGYLLLSDFNATNTSAIDGTRFGMGGSDGTSMQALSHTNEDNVATTNVDTVDRTDHAMVLMPNYSGTQEAIADHSAFGSDGFTLSWTTSHSIASELIYIAFGGNVPVVASDSGAGHAATVLSRAYALVDLITTHSAALLERSQGLLDLITTHAAAPQAREALLTDLIATHATSIPTFTAILPLKTDAISTHATTAGLVAVLPLRSDASSSFNNTAALGVSFSLVDSGALTDSQAASYAMAAADAFVAANTAALIAAIGGAESYGLSAENAVLTLDGTDYEQSRSDSGALVVELTSLVVTLSSADTGAAVETLIVGLRATDANAINLQQTVQSVAILASDSDSIAANTINALSMLQTTSDAIITHADAASLSALLTSQHTAADAGAHSTVARLAATLAGADSGGLLTAAVTGLYGSDLAALSELLVAKSLAAGDLTLVNEHSGLGDNPIRVTDTGALVESIRIALTGLGDSGTLVERSIKGLFGTDAGAALLELAYVTQTRGPSSGAVVRVGLNSPKTVSTTQGPGGRVVRTTLVEN